MKTIFNYIKSIFNLNQASNNQDSNELVNCNYANNYYGDQYCQPKQ
ncbi:MAG: hypothetical protein JKX78_14645 [Alteromonadaceae bacterium]|nr:hypothetical protein [Alteromonadaceae bacterium]